MRYGRLDAVVMLVVFFVMSLALVGCPPATPSSVPGSATTQPAMTSMEVRLGLLTEANEAYATAENVVADLHSGGTISDAAALAAFKDFQVARGYLKTAKTLLVGGTLADF